MLEHLVNPEEGSESEGVCNSDFKLVELPVDLLLDIVPEGGGKAEVSGVTCMIDVV
jgi:hypothetical protein